MVERDGNPNEPELDNKTSVGLRLLSLKAAPKSRLLFDCGGKNLSVSDGSNGLRKDEAGGANVVLWARSVVLSRREDPDAGVDLKSKSSVGETGLFGSSAPKP